MEALPPKRIARRARRITFSAALAAAALAGVPAAASADPVAGAKLTIAAAKDQPCVERLLKGDGVAHHALPSAAASGELSARLRGAGESDWDLAVLDADSGRVVAGSAQLFMEEVAQGFVVRGQRLLVQACRRSGAADSAQLEVDLAPISADRQAGPAQLVRVATGTRARVRELQALGLDLTEHGRAGFLELVLYGDEDREKLRRAGFSYTVEIADLAEADRQARLADTVFSRQVRTSAFPSGRDRYRRLADYNEDMKRLARENPALVRSIVLPFKTYEGRQVEGIEITEDVAARDGKPVFLQLGVHHAREWPSSEHAIEWAFELVNGYRGGDARTRSLVQRTRTIVVPIVNPDGFNASREAGELRGAGGGRGESYDGNELDETAYILAHTNEYRRKNCRFPDDSEGGNCAQPGQGLAEAGVDPNRNYGGFWGGPGASSDPLNLTYRGPGPFSEPETRNIRDLVSKRQVTTLITNHTFSNLVLRPPGIQSQGPPPDEPLYKALGDSMAAENGYESQRSYQLYDTTGTTEDWSYYATGGLGFTFEIGPEHFHPRFSDTVAEYDGTTPASDREGRDGGGNREAYFRAQEHTAEASNHSVITGSAPAGAVLRLKKTFKTPTYPQEDGKPILFDDTLDTTMRVPSSGRFRWHVNPSTRPLVQQERGRPARGEPSPQQRFAGSPAGPDDAPEGDDGAAPCANFDDPPSSCYNDHLFTVPSGEGIDNARMRVRAEWATVASDWDLKVYRADESGDATGEPIATSGQGTTDFEETDVAEPVLEPGRRYVARMINWAAAEPYEGTITFEGPQPYEPVRTEAWTLTCESPEGTARVTREVIVSRGAVSEQNLSACAAQTPRSRSRFVISHENVRMTRDGFAPVRVRCASGSRCTGVMRIENPNRGAHASGHLMGWRRFSIAPGRRVLVRVPIQREDRRAVRSRRSGMRVRVVARPRFGDSAARTHTKSVRLLPPSR